MNCPKCGYERQSRDDAFVPPGECPACGLVYAKHDATRESDDGTSRVQAPNLRPSPVDALSLRKARERVEKRLREQQRKRVPDDRHAQTLELAKQFASEELRKRQEQRRQACEETEASAIADSDGESCAPVPRQEPAPADQGAPDHQPQDVEPAADELITTAEDVMEPTADAAAPIESVEEDAPEQADVEDTVMAEESREDPESGSDDEVETAWPEVSREAPEPGPDDEVETAWPEVSREAPEPGPDVEVETAWPDADETAPDGETLPAAASLSVDPEAEIPVSTDDLPAAHVAAAAMSPAPRPGPKAGLARLLPIVAWLILGAGVVGAFLSWTTIHEVEAGARIPMAEGMNGFPLGLLLGFAYLATGVLGFAFFWVSSLISNQLKDIHHLLLAAERDKGS
jgi:hypothetical protein